MIVQPDLAQARRALVMKHRAQALLGFGAPVLRVMRVKASCNAHPRHARRRLASTAGEKPLHGKRGLVVPLREAVIGGRAVLADVDHRAHKANPMQARTGEREPGVFLILQMAMGCLLYTSRCV